MNIVPWALVVVFACLSLFYGRLAGRASAQTKLVAASALRAQRAAARCVELSGADLRLIDPDRARFVGDPEGGGLLEPPPAPGERGRRQP